MRGSAWLVGVWNGEDSPKAAQQLFLKKREGRALPSRLVLEVM